MTATDPADEIAKSCLAVRARVLNRMISSIFDESLRPFELKVSQLNVLVAIAKLGPCSPGAVSTALRLEKSTLSRNLERIRKRGWVRASEGADRRSREVSITAAGKRLLSDVLPAWREAQRVARRTLGAADADTLSRMGSDAMAG